MDQKIIDKINEETDIVQLASEFISLEKRGKNFMGLCPFHQENTPSFSVSPEKNIAMCMSCGEGGRALTFYQKIKNISFEQACIELGERLGLDMKVKPKKADPNQTYYLMMEEAVRFYQFNLRQTSSGHAALNYVLKRGITDETIDHFKIGFSPRRGDALYNLLKDKGYKVSDMIHVGLVKQNEKGFYYDLFSERLMFPITDDKGRVIAFSGRTLKKMEQIKYINSPETVIFKKGQSLYHLFEAAPDIRKHKEIILQEGFFDVISSYQAGIKHGIASMGTALTLDQAKLMESKATYVTIMYDGDKAGQEATLKAIQILKKTKLLIRVVILPNRLDPDDYIKQYGSEAYQEYISQFQEDPYAFMYRFYKNGKDLKNANDIKIFKDNILSMIKEVDSSIKKIYLNQLAVDLNMDVTHFLKEKKIEPGLKRIEKAAIQKKYISAERYLISALIKHKACHDLMQKHLEDDDYVSKEQHAIRLKIHHYYDEHDEMDMLGLLEYLSDEQRNYFTDIIVKDMHFELAKKYNEQEVLTSIKYIKSARDLRKLNEIEEELKYEDFNENRTVVYKKVETRDNIIKKLKETI